MEDQAQVSRANVSRAKYTDLMVIVLMGKVTIMKKRIFLSGIALKGKSQSL